MSANVEFERADHLDHCTAGAATACALAGGCFSIALLVSLFVRAVTALAM
jgi:hypothetical protein